MDRQMNQMSGRHGPGFTPKQGQYLAFIDAYTRVNRRPPAEWEMQRHFGVTPPSVRSKPLRRGTRRRRQRANDLAEARESQRTVTVFSSLCAVSMVSQLAST
jgi:hypothetical protein